MYRATDVSPKSMAMASQSSLEAQWISRTKNTRYELIDLPEILRAFTGAPFQSLNCVPRARFNKSEADAWIEETHNYFGSKGVPMIWWISPFSNPSDLGERLVAHGAERLPEELPAMAMDLQHLNDKVSTPTELTIEQVTDDEGLRRFVSAFVSDTVSPENMREAFYHINADAGYGNGDVWRHYVGILSGEPVATASLCLAQGVAGINAVSTAPGARRRGIGSAVTLTALRYARQQGYRIGALKSSEMAFAMYQQIGFKEYFKYTIYVWRNQNDQTICT